jgi:hypothetical protein
MATGHDLADLGTLGRGAPRKMAPNSGAESREEHAGIMLVKAGGVCEGVHTAGILWFWEYFGPGNEVWFLLSGCARTKSSRPFNGLQIA